MKNIRERLPLAKGQRSSYLMFNLFYRKYGRLTDLLCKCITYQRIGRIAEKVTHYLK